MFKKINKNILIEPKKFHVLNHVSKKIKKMSRVLRRILSLAYISMGLSLAQYILTIVFITTFVTQ